MVNYLTLSVFIPVFYSKLWNERCVNQVEITAVSLVISKLLSVVIVIMVIGIVLMSVLKKHAQ
jgi:hypothetical protein